MSIQIRTVRAERPVFNAWIYGDPGSGKTTLAASAQDHPDLRDVLVANVEGGMLSIAYRGDIKEARIESSAHLETLFWELINNRKKFGKYRTIVIDSVTELQTLNLEELVEEAVEKARKQNKARSRDEIYQDDYGRSTTQLKRVLRWFKDAPFNVIYTGLAKYVYPNVARGTDLSNVDPLAVLPSLTNKLAKSLMGYVDFVWYTHYDAEDRKYQLYTVANGVIQAKTRGPKFAQALGPVVDLRVRGKQKYMLPEIYDLMCKTLSGPATKTATTKPPAGEEK